MVIILALLIPVSALMTGYFTLHAYERGLTHNYELKHDVKPTPTAIEKALTKGKEPEQNNILSEWLYGEGSE